MVKWFDKLVVRWAFPRLIKQHEQAKFMRLNDGPHHLLVCSVCGHLAAHNVMHVATRIPAFFSKPRATVKAIEDQLDVYYLQQTILHALHHERLANALRERHQQR